MKSFHVELTVNGRPRESTVEPRHMLSELLREDLELTGTHLGCEHGVCGACTVLLDGEAVRSCLVLAVQARGRSVTTVEGLASESGVMHPVQQAFSECLSFQCGFCTPGFVMATVEFIDGLDGVPDDAAIREALSGNLCRCTGYQSIVDGVRLAAQRAAGLDAVPPGGDH